MYSMARKVLSHEYALLNKSIYYCDRASTRKVCCSQLGLLISIPLSILTAPPMLLDLRIQVACFQNSVGNYDIGQYGLHSNWFCIKKYNDKNTGLIDQLPFWG